LVEAEEGMAGVVVLGLVVGSKKGVDLVGV
jgi:hypothetical protein